MHYFADTARTRQSLPSHPIPSPTTPKRKRESSSPTAPGMSMVILQDPATYADSSVVYGSNSTIPCSKPSSRMLQAKTNINLLKVRTLSRSFSCCTIVADWGCVEALILSPQRPGSSMSQSSSSYLLYTTTAYGISVGSELSSRQ